MPKLVFLIFIGILGWWIAVDMSLAHGVELEARGVVVEGVGEGSTLEKAGIEPGDVLLSWRRLPSPPANPEEAQGEIGSVFDWIRLVVEQAPRGLVELAGSRGKKELVFTVTPGLWEVEVRPRMKGWVLDDYQRGRNNFEANKTQLAADLWMKVAREAEDQRLRCWLLQKLGEVWSEEKEWAKAHAAYIAAIEETDKHSIQAMLVQAIGRDFEKQSDLKQALLTYSSAISIHEGSSKMENLALASAVSMLGNLQKSLGDSQKARESHLRALRIRQRLSPHSLGVASSLNNLGVLSEDLVRAADLHQRALAIRKELAPGSLAVATSYNNLGIIARERGDFPEALALYQRALKIKQKAAPGSLSLASSFTNLCSLSLSRGHLKHARDCCKEALEIYEDLTPGSIYVASVLVNLGNVAGATGDLNGAYKLFRDALDIYQHVAPNNPSVPKVLNNLGRVALARGDIERSIEFHRRALEIKELTVPGTLTMAVTLNNLGIVFSKRGEWPRAISYFQRALAIREKEAPGSPYVAASLNNLAYVAARAGDLEHATELQLRAIGIQRTLAPESLHVAQSLGNLGYLLRQRGDLNGAEGYHLQAKELKERIAPESLHLATTLRNLGEISLERGKRTAAEEFYRRSLELSQELAPDSVGVAETLRELGVLHRLSDPPQLANAGNYLDRALSVIERQLGRLGGSHELRAGYRAQYSKFYREALEIQLERDEQEVAFYTLERSRAKSFLEHLAEREAVFTTDIPDELDRGRRQVAVGIDRVQRELAELNRRDHAAQIEGLLEDLRELQDEARDIEEKIRRTSPRLAALQYPVPLDLNAVRATLDPGTLALSYSVSDASTIIFAVSKEHGLSVREIVITEEQLRGRVQNIIQQIQSARHRGSQRMLRFESAARSLYDTLIGPIEDMLSESERILILGDGPLHYMPWAALIRETPGGGRFLAEWKPVHLALSATVFGELKKLRRESSEGQSITRIAAFGDPSYPGRSIAAGRHLDPGIRSVTERCSFDFDGLPHTRYEIESIAGNFPANQVRVYFAEQATEERLKAVGSNTRIVHIAAHGCMDERFPLNSFVALTVPEEYQEGRDNGLLQAWEIFERVRLDADLVVLSACETALGEELGGEGLYGLTRAFQYAGARSVAASLWNVADQTTAELMIRFYRHLSSGLPKDEALRAAQLEFIQEPIEVTNGDGQKVQRDASAPYYWAAFQIFGDWQ
ncbi:MAG: CHAT domain-containing protein [bacterium]|nr:CHAT domain-containing protein [bacterium]